MPPRPPTDEEIAWMLAHADDTLVTNIITCCSVCGVASTVFLALRIWSRKIIHGHIVLEMSDWLLVIAHALYVGFLSTFAATTAYGEGKHIIFVENARLLQICTIVSEVFYNLSVTFIKFSILRFYGSIFISRLFRRYLWAVAALMGGWGISTSVVAVVQCIPIEFSWDHTIIGGYCVDYRLTVLIAGVLNIVTDFVILAMPIPLIWQLHVSRQKKYLLMFTFAMGSSACIISIIRLVFALKIGTADSSWDNVPPGLLNTVELMVGILAVSIPVYRPLYRSVFRGPVTPRNSRGLYAIDYNSYFPTHTTKVSVGRPQQSTHRGIQVTDQIELVKHASRNGAWVKVTDEDETELVGERRSAGRRG